MAKMLSRKRNASVWLVALMAITCIVTGLALAATDADAPEATETEISLVGSPTTGGAGGAGGAAGGAGGGATGGGGADVRVAQY